ncbi:cysteinyl-tRNA synthetase [Thermobaculum terrenum ATCC BAA-798]|uniref:Cysteine--tRNA ligase n=1 Tax=Thermobaculum terrenum (strain ATCC BAA-798 / CCMEE 7001 / YNP1) TaxID=525904 RepID=D1CIB0_THET1|nr:cysteine--tRNA ligase [Thermobaculum terrenum]ACZ43481.1 cysteinyl-tRNA synthetase [Thermobaculum terrenum ATCC BAA-798]
MRLYNTLTRRVEEVVPVEPGRIRMYTCGPTVYRYIHIGNLRSFCTADWIRRALLREGYEVIHVKNITDVGHMRQELLDQGEDKLEAEARRVGRTPGEIAEFYTRAFMRDEARMNILPASVFPRATQHVGEMIEIVRELERQGYAYRAGGNVYFDVARLPQYGQLSGNSLPELTSSQEDATADKRSPLDFALWKEAEPGRLMAWDSPWGRGFPGWHIECTAMAIKYLGTEIDIHTGGVDNIFPHHENERAQSEAYVGHRWVRHWVHTQHLLTDGLKMSKSMSNDYTLDDIVARGFEPLALRYLFTTAHYRTRLNFTFRALAGAQTSLRRLRMAALAARDEAVAPPDEEAMRPWREAFDRSLRDDLNLPAAMAVVWDVVRRSGLGPAERAALLAEFDEVLGLDVFAEPDSGLLLEPRQDVRELLALRAEVRARGDYALADALRSDLEARGVELRDTRQGTRAYRLRINRLPHVFTSSAEVPSRVGEPDRYEWSVNLIARNNREDLERCLRSLARHLHGRSLEVVVVDSGSTDDTLGLMLELYHRGYWEEEGVRVPLKVLFADHNIGFAASRNATMRASEGWYVVWLDTSVELAGDVWTPLEEALADRSVGVAGPFGLVTEDLREFERTPGPDADAMEGYLFAFRRALLEEVGLLDNEKFRFYRLADVYYSFFFKAAGLRVVVVPEVERRIILHPHREWYSLLPEERQTKSKHNYDLFRARWHHGESLLVARDGQVERWLEHDHPRHVDADHFHPPEELPPPGVPHVHPHRHLPDHQHNHPHYHFQGD